MITGWRYWYRRYFGWIPIQFCMVCGKWYWGGLPRWWVIREGFKVTNKAHPSYPNGFKTRGVYRIRMTWAASWMDYCSMKCSYEDPEVWELDRQAKQRKEQEEYLLQCLNANQCPDCKQSGFLEGPSAGIMTNVECKHCGKRFNYCPPCAMARKGIAHRI